MGIVFSDEFQRQMEHGRHTGPAGPRRRCHRRQHRDRLPHRSRARPGRRPGRLGGARPGEGQPRAGTHRRRPAGRRCHAAGTRPQLAGLGARRRRGAAQGLPAHRSADQQRRGDVDSQAAHRRRVRNAVRHQPSGPLRADRVIAGQPAAGAGLAGGDRQQHGPPAPRRDPLRRSAMGTAATTGMPPTGSRSWPTCCSPTSCSTDWPATGRTPSPSPPTPARPAPSWAAMCRR